MRKLLVLKLDGDLEKGVRVTLSVEEEDNRLGTEITGYLPPNSAIATAFDQWRSNYRSLGNSTRMKADNVTYVDYIGQWISDCQKSDSELRKHLNQWLLSESFRPIRDKCLQQFIPPAEVRVLIRTSSKSLFKLPWHLWDLVENYPKAEVALCAPDSHPKTLGKTPTLRGKVKILAILGNSFGINIQKDRQLLKNLPDAETTFLVEPQRQDINDHLWEQSWDILFFAGHSKTEGDSGHIYINKTESLIIAELRYGLRNAVDNGLALAIFNSCDGMGLAFELQQLHIPQVIVMREPVLDIVAQQFLTYFLPAFAAGKSLYLAEREARLKLHGLENEYPCASWLPVIFQNPATVPLSWQELGRRPTDKCPYRGLFAFREEDAPFFRGREAFTQILVQAVQKQPLVAVIGPSGSGKSSVVFAGLIPRLRESGFWRIVSFRPGDKPLHALAAALVSQNPTLNPSSAVAGAGGTPARRCSVQAGRGAEGNQGRVGSPDQLLEIIQLADNLRSKDNALRSVVEKIVWEEPGTKLLLVADQFEELYTLCQDTQERQVFLDRLLETTKQENFTLVLTLRADFLGQPLSYRPFADALQYADLKLGSMNREELQAAVQQPAALFDVTLEEGLTERILDVVSTQAGDLPLLEFALHELWAKQRDVQLTHAAYDEIGGVESAVASYAEQIIGRLNELEKERARRIFLQLVRPGEGTEDTRRLAIRAEVGGDDNWDLVRRLADARLVVTGWNEGTGEETVEIVHEALIREWITLREWMNANRQFRTWQERLKGAVREWKNSKHDTGALFRGVPLAVAEDWLHKRSNEMTQQERDFIRASVQQRDREQKERERRRRFIISGLAIGLSGALSLAGFALWQLRQAEIAKSEVLSRTSNILFSQGKEFNALIESLRAGVSLQRLKAEPSMQMVATLRQAVYGVRERNRLEGHTGTITSVVFSPDGKTIATDSNDNTVKLWNQQGQLLTTLSGSANKVVFSPDGNTIATGSFVGAVKLWNQQGQLLTTLSGSAKSVVFSPNGKTIATGSYSDNTVKLWNQQGQLLTTLSDSVKSIVFSPDGKTIATGSSDNTVKLWNQQGQPLTTLSGHSGAVNSVVFSPDGKTIATGSDDNTVKLWNLNFDDLLERGCDWVRDYLKTNSNVSESDQRLCDGID
ncbi:CHAT domain-containing protein [Tolypothrix campylonemoides VB511288]|nr:CHAT domain-containing protein [Tolypothrix campylonemoides VB511288]